jgi:hypothetical protein
MEMFSPVDSMAGMQMGDDDGPADPSTMTCRIIADLEAYPVAPFGTLRASTPDYGAICPAGVMMGRGGSAGSAAGRVVTVFRVQFAATGTSVVLTTAQQAEFQDEVIRALISRMSDDTSSVDVMADGDPTCCPRLV